MEKKLKIGDKIREVRLRRNLTQEDLAEMIDVVPNYLSMIECNNKYPSLDVLIKIGKALNTSFDYLLSNESDTNKLLNLKYKETIKDISKLKPELQEEFLDISNNIAKSFNNIQRKIK